MGLQIQRQFGNPLITFESKNSVQTLTLSKPQIINQIVTMEDLQEGQKIAKYTIEAKVGSTWKTIVNGQTIGHKRIDQFAPVTASSIRFTVTESLVKPAVLRSISIFNNSCLSAKK